MSKANWKWKERELTRAMRAARKAGVLDFTARVTPTGAIEIEARATEVTTKTIDSDEWRVE